MKKPRLGWWHRLSILIFVNACGSNTPPRIHPPDPQTGSMAGSATHATAGVMPAANTPIAGMNSARPASSPPTPTPTSTARPMDPQTAQSGAGAPTMAMAPSAAGTGGGSAPPPTAAKAGNMANLDKSVRFDWPETTPGQAQCEAGKYVGMFNCTLMSDPNLGLLIPVGAEFSGPITLEFTRSADGEFLELTNAKLNGLAADTIGFMADLNGKLNCTTRALTATIMNGQYGLGSPIIFPGGELVGTLMGQLDIKTGELTGTWSMTDKVSEGLFACVGPWQATRSP